MKNLKKVLSFVLAIGLVCSTLAGPAAVSSFAKGTSTKKAKVALSKKKLSLSVGKKAKLKIKNGKKLSKKVIKKLK